MDYPEYLKEYYIIIPGEFKAIQIKDNTIHIVDGHYSIGVKFIIYEINGINYLKYGDGYIGLMDNKLKVCSKLDKFDSLVTFGEYGGDSYLTKLKVMGGYLDNEMKVNSLENALSIQWMWCGLVNDEDIKDLSNTLCNIKTEIKYVSIDGVNLLDESRFFYMIEGGGLSEHALCYEDEDNSLGFFCQYTYNLKFKFKLIDENIIIYNPEFGYLKIGENTDGEDAAVFSKNIPKSPITLIKTDKKSIYLLGQNNKFVQIDCANAFSFTSITDDRCDAAEFQFVLINENVKDWS